MMESLGVGARRFLLEFDFNPSRLRALQAIMISLSSLSFMGGLFVVSSFLRFERLRARFAFEQVANMALADMGASVTYWFGSPRDRSGLCTSQAVLQQTFELSSILWATVIAHTLSFAIRRRESLPSDRVPVYAFAWGLPALISLLPLSTSSYGAAGAWCWIRPKPRRESNAWRFSAFYGPAWAAMLYNAYVYARAALVLHRLSTTVAGDETSLKLKQTIKRLVRYPLILVVCWFFPTVNRIQQTVHSGNPVFTLYVLTAISRSLIGSLNALNFGWTPAVKAEWTRECAALRDGGDDDSGLAIRRGGAGKRRGGGDDDASPSEGGQPEDQSPQEIELPAAIHKKTFSTLDGARDEGQADDDDDDDATRVQAV